MSESNPFDDVMAAVEEQFAYRARPFDMWPFSHSRLQDDKRFTPYKKKRRTPFNMHPWNMMLLAAQVKPSSHPLEAAWLVWLIANAIESYWVRKAKELQHRSPKTRIAKLDEATKAVRAAIREMTSLAREESALEGTFSDGLDVGDETITHEAADIFVDLHYFRPTSKEHAGPSLDRILEAAEQKIGERMRSDIKNARGTPPKTIDALLADDLASLFDYFCPTPDKQEQRIEFIMHVFTAINGTKINKHGDQVGNRQSSSIYELLTQAPERIWSIPKELSPSRPANYWHNAICGFLLPNFVALHIPTELFRLPDSLTAPAFADDEMLAFLAD